MIFQSILDEGDNVPFLGVADEDEKETEGDIPTNAPILALTNTVLYPGTVIPITIGREKSIAAVNKAYKEDKWIVAFTQISKKTEDRVKRIYIELVHWQRLLKN